MKKSRIIARICITALFVAALAILGGCARPEPAKTIEALEAERLPARVTVQPGDILEFKFFYVPELNDIQTIRPDGKVVMQLVGEVDAQGLTPSELTAEIKKRYTGVLKKPEVAVITRELASRRVYVGGEVVSPGPVDMRGKLYALQAIMFAGGFDKETAEPANVILIRHRNGKRYGAAIDFSKALAGQDAVPVELEPNDILFVPQTTIANVNQWIDQHINKVIPKLGSFANYNYGSGTIGFDFTTFR